MIIPGELAIKRGLITNLATSAIQVHPQAVDLSLKTIQTFTSPGTIKVNHTVRATTQDLRWPSPHGSPLHLAAGTYVARFNESVNLLKLNEGVDEIINAHGELSTRNMSLGILVQAQPLVYWDGPVYAVLQVLNPHGINLYKNARIAQVAFHTGD
ncbi:hypothetical protein MBLNU457_g0954t1 [Dothideomycetes sp. NU457]